MKTILIFYISFFLFAVLSCNENSKNRDIDISDIKVVSNITRLDSILFSLGSEAKILDFLEENKLITKSYFETTEQEFPQLAKKLNEFIRNPALIDFYRKSINTQGGIKIDSIQTELDVAFKHIKYYYPEFSPPKIYTIFTGFTGKDLYVSDSLIVIGLDYFVGGKAAFRPQVYDYQLSKYKKEYIVPSIINLLASNYEQLEASDKTLLADMLFYGKCFQFTKTMIPNVADTLVIGYSQKQLDETEISQDMVWGHFIDQKLLYDNSPFKKAKYLEERPNTQEISPDCPGMIGRWLGWKIVKKFMENNPKETISMVMKNSNAQNIFTRSKYKGRPDTEKPF